MSWIKSAGGPLICLEAKLASLWAGVNGLTVASATAANDYKRVCETRVYLTGIPLTIGSALILGGEPLNTTLFLSSEGSLFAVRLFFAEPDFDLDTAFRKIDQSAFSRPMEATEFVFGSSDIMLFDSADPGIWAKDNDAASFSIEPGRYRILTQQFDLGETMLLMHRFDELR